MGVCRMSRRNQLIQNYFNIYVRLEGNCGLSQEIMGSLNETDIGDGRELRVKRFSSGTQPRHSSIGLISSSGTFFGTRKYPKVQSPQAPISGQHPNTFKESVLPFHQLIGQQSQIDLGWD